MKRVLVDVYYQTLVFSDKKMPATVAVFAAVLLIQFVQMLPVSRSQIQETEALSYLRKFGYLQEPDPRFASMIQYSQFTDALSEFQRFANLPVTGVLDEATQRQMGTPRCGVPDVVRTKPMRGNRDKRSQPAMAATLGGKWKMREITWHISRGTNQIPLKELNDEFERAWKVWTDHVDLSVQRTDSNDSHIDILFVEYDHQCLGGPFDGSGNTVAHAFYPRYGGDVHFDESENWLTNEIMQARYNQYNSVSGLNLLLVAAHEFGHALGLEHSRDSAGDSLMRPFYSKVLNVTLSVNDIRDIQALYGKPVRDICEDAKIDAVTTTADGKTYVFKRDLYYELTRDGLSEGFPKMIADDWYNLPGNLDAAFTWKDGRTFFFKGDKYWRFENMVPERGYPRLITEGFPLIPDNLSAAFTWNGNNHTYFIKGSQYWRYQPTIEIHHNSDGTTIIPGLYRYPRSLVYWAGVPLQIDAVLPWTDGNTYFFSGAKYYRLNDSTLRVDGSPGWTAVDWFGCDPDRVSQSDVNDYSSTVVNMAMDVPKYVASDWVVVSHGNKVPAHFETVPRIQVAGGPQNLMYHSSARPAKISVCSRLCAIVTRVVMFYWVLLICK